MKYIDIERHADSRLVKPVARECCIYCGACVCVNPYPGTGFVNGELVFDPESVLFEKDLYVCPVIVPVHSITDPTPPFEKGQTQDKLLGPYREICSARSTNEKILKGAQVGGVVTSLLVKAMEEKQIDSALLVDRYKGWVGKPRLAASTGEIIECAGTKLSEASVLTYWRDAIKKGYRKLAIVGMPCVTIAEYLIDHVPDFKEFKDIHSLSIGIFCMGEFSYRGLFNEFLSKNQGINPYNIVKVDVKGRMIIHEITVEDKIAVHTYSLEKLRRYGLLGCIPCHDYAAEYADISVGSVGSETGWNTVIVRTEKGKKLFDSAVESGMLVKNETMDLELLKRSAALKKELKLGPQTREPPSKVLADWELPVERTQDFSHKGMIIPYIEQEAKKKGSQILW